MSQTADAILFEVVRHRLSAITDEAAATIAVVSGSPVANEGFDFNTALMDADGQVLMIGPYVMAHAAALDFMVRHLLAEYEENPGIGPGDMFLCNDPYVGAMHQPDVALVAPIYVDGERVMWCGSVVHQTDVGGPLAGSIGIGARSIYEEAIPLAPIKIVEGGRLRKDLEREYLIRSRMPGLNALDLRGQIAANRLQTERIETLIARYGRDAILRATGNLVDSTERRFRARLAALPDGRWNSVSLVEHDGVQDKVYPVRVTVTKRHDQLELDFSASADQAPALINTALPALHGYSLAPLLTNLAFDMPWCPAAISRAVTIVSRKGSVVDCEWPAGVSQATTAVGHAVRTAVHVCIAGLLDGSDEYADHVMASCMGSYAGQNIAGVRDDGSRFGTMLMDSLGGGGGASEFADGIDTAGVTNAPKSAIGNVETNEHNYPILYLWRRQTIDSGGAGRHRGGMGGEHAYVVHEAGGVESILFAHGVEQPTGLGVAGGEPGSTHRFTRVAGARDLTARREGDFVGQAQNLPPKGTQTFGDDDVFVHVYGGGGGLGDPLERPYAEVLADVEGGAVSEARARADYFVVIGDEAGTQRVRAEERVRRVRGLDPAPRGVPDVPGRRLSRHCNVHGDVYVCRHCATEWGSTAAGPVTHLHMDELPVGERWPAVAQLPGAARFVLRRFFCPGCGTQVEAEINLKDAEPLGGAEAIAHEEATA